MTLRVAHIVNSTFGSIFSGHTHYLFSLLSGWSDKEISMGILGNRIKPINMNSGDLSYRLPADTLWTNPIRQDRWSEIRWSFKLIRLLIERRQDYEIIHFHRLSWGSLLSPLLLHPLHKKVVFTMSLMGNDNPGYINEQPRGRLQVALLRQFDGAIGLSPALVADARKHGIENVICLPNFLAIPELESELTESEFLEVKNLAKDHFNIPRDSQVLLFVGSIIKRKGLDILIDCFVNLAYRYPSLYLVLVGPSKKQETDSIDENFVLSLRKSIDSTNFGNRVIWAGMVRDQSILVKYYRCADIFVLPTRNEGSPNVLAEAMSANLPVVVSELSGITDAIVTNNESGYLVKPNDTAGFTNALDELLNNNEKREAMGNTGRKVAIEKFGFDSYRQKLKVFYLNLFLNKSTDHA